MSTTFPSYSSMIEGRVRRSCGSLERQTAQSHPSVGTPMEVPLPSTGNVALIALSSSAGSGGRSRLWRPRQRVGHFDIGHAQFVKTVLQEIFLHGSQVAFGFSRDQAQRIN